MTTGYEGFHTVSIGGTVPALFSMLHGGFGVREHPDCVSRVMGTVDRFAMYNEISPCFNRSRQILKVARDAGYMVGASTNLALLHYIDLSDPHHMAAPAMCDPREADGQLRWKNCGLTDCLGRAPYVQQILQFNKNLHIDYQDVPKFLVRSRPKVGHLGTSSGRPCELLSRLELS